MSRVLYTYWRSSAAYRVRIALGLKALPYESRVVDLRTGAQGGVGYRMLNPQGLVPLLIDGDVAIAQTLAIMEYLEEAYPERPLLPRGPAERARVRAAALMLIADTHPLINLVGPVAYLRDTLGHEQPALDGWVTHWIARGLAPLEEAAEAGAGPYMFGDTPTIADVTLVPQMYSARRLRMDLTAYPRLVAIDKRMNAMPEVRAAAPENQADADQPSIVTSSKPL